MPKPTTNFTGLSVNGNDANSTNGLYVPKLTTAQRNAINIPNQKKLGGIIYNTTANRFEIYNSNGWTPITGGAGNGDVVGPNSSTTGAVPLFADETGKVLQDSGLDIRNVLNEEEGIQRRVGGLELSGLTYLKFSSETSAIYVDALTGIQFITNDFGSDSQVCSLLTSGLPSSSTSPSALLEIQSSTGAFLMSRMTSAQRDGLTASNGMILYNTTTNKVEAHVNGAWITLSGGGSGSGDVSGPNVSVTNDIAVFSDSSGKVLADSGASISVVSQSLEEGTLANVNQLSGLGSINFNNSGNVLVNNIGGVQYIVNNFQFGQQVCALLTGNGLSSSSSPSALLEIKSNYGAFLMSRLSTAQRNSLLSPISGMMLYNAQTGNAEIYGSGGSGWRVVNTTSATVSGPSSQLPNNNKNSVAIFGDSSGQVISNCDVFIQNNSQSVKELSGLGSLKFATSGAINVDALSGIQLINNNFGSGSQVCSLLTGGSLSSSSSPSALLEIQSTTGSFLMSRMTSAQRDSLTASNGMMLYNTTSKKVEAYIDNIWGSISGSGNVSGPNVSMANNAAVFSDSSGKIIKDSSLNVSINDGNLILSTPDSSNYNSSIGVGYGALSNVALSTGNIALGNRAFTGGSEDNPVQATGTNNIAIGGLSLYRNVSSSNTVSVGGGSLSFLDNGDGNVCVGANSGINYQQLKTTVIIGSSTGNNRLNDLNCVYIGANVQTTTNKAANTGIANSVAIGAGSQVLTSNSMSLGKGINVGIANSSASYALDMGLENGIIPLIRMSPTSVPASPPLLGDGIYFNNNGQASYKSYYPRYSGGLVTSNSSDANASTAGIVTLNGLSGVVVNTTAVKTNSVILVTHYRSTLSAGDPVGTLVITNIVGGSSFTIRSTNSGDTSQAYWQLINPT